MHKITYLFLSLILVGCGGGGGNQSSLPTNPESGGGNQSSLPTNPESGGSTPTTKPITELLSVNSGVFGAFPIETDHFDYGGVISRSTGRIDISMGTSQGAFNIICSAGENPRYYFDTNDITANGNVRYDIGFNFSKSEVWNEVPNSYRTLIPLIIDNSIYEKLYKNNFFDFYWNKYLGATVKAGIDISGFPLIVDKTRDICGWDTSKFPPDNGWNTYLPIYPPSHAREAITVSGRTTHFRTIAWKAKNSKGEDQLLVRVGDYEGEGPCNSVFMIGDQFFARQNGKLIELKKGYATSISCRSPTIVALQGDYDINQPFTLEIYPAITGKDLTPWSLNEPDGPFAILNF